MLGKWTEQQLWGMGQNPLDTVKQTLRTTEDVLPAVEVMAEDYVKVSPFINFLADYWAVALVITGATVAVGSAIGSWTVLKRLENKR